MDNINVLLLTVSAIIAFPTVVGALLMLAHRAMQQNQAEAPVEQEQSEQQ